MEIHGREAAWFGTAMVCENGHTITDEMERYPERGAPFCPQCGAKTLTACPECGTKIRGYYSEGSPLAHYSPPAFCHNCGKSLPWTRSSIRAWHELVDESGGLSTDEKERLQGSIDDLIVDTPSTNTAVMRVKKWLVKAGNVVGPSVKQIITDVGTEAVKKSMGL